MRSRSRLLLGLLCAAAFAPTARAANLPFAGTLSLRLAAAPGNVSFTIGGTGVATVNGSGGGGHLSAWTLPAGAFATDALVVPATSAATVSGFPVVASGFLDAQNAAGAFTGSGGTMPLMGAARVCLFAPCLSPPPANVSVPLSVVGSGGSKSVSFSVLLTVTGAPWTTGTATAAGLPPVAGFRHGPASGTSSTATASGTIRLVTPLMVSTNIAAFAAGFGYAVLTLHFVPEPGTVWLLAGGFALLGLGGRKLRERGSSETA